MPSAAAASDPTPMPQSKRDGEAATALTDALMAAQSLFYAQRLGRTALQSGLAAQCWRGAMAAAGLAAAAGAGYHGLPPQVLPGLRAVFWKVIGVATGAAGALLLIGDILASSVSAWRWVWAAVALFKSVALGVNTWRRGDFRTIIYDYGSSLVALLLLQGWRPGPASPAIRRGVLLSILAAAIQQKGPVLHPRFDRNALYHLVQMAALHFFYRASRRLGQTPDRR